MRKWKSQIVNVDPRKMSALLSGDSHTVVKSSDCKVRHPEFKTKLLVISDCTGRRIIASVKKTEVNLDIMVARYKFTIGKMIKL